MSDTSVVDPDETPSAVTAGNPLVVAQPTVQDPDKAAGFLARHQAAGEAARGNYEDIMRRRQEAIDAVRGKLDSTIDEMRSRHNDTNRTNLPLLALSAGLLRGSGRGAASNFGADLGEGLAGMGATIARQRGQDDTFAQQVAELQRQSGAMGDIVPKEQAQLAKEQQLKEEQQASGLERALITTKANRPYSVGKDAMGNPIIFDSRANGGAGAFVGADGKPVDVSKAGPGLPADGPQPEWVKDLPDGVDAKKLAAYPEEIRNRATRVINGLDPMPSTARNNPLNNAVINAVAAASPGFDPAQAKAAADTIKKVGSGKINEGITAFGTYNEHMSQLATAGEALKNGNLPLLNKIANKLGVAAGSTAQITFNNIREAALHEQTNILSGHHMTDAEMKAAGATIDQGMTPAQLTAAAEAGHHLVDARMGNLYETAYTSAGKRVDKYFSRFGYANGKRPQQGSDKAAPSGAPAPGTVLGKTKDGREVYVGADGKQYVR